MNENSNRNSKSACGDRTKARTAWMTPNATSSAVTTGGTFSIGSEGVLTPKRPPRPLPGHKAPGARRQARAFCDKEPGADLIRLGHGFAQNMRPDAYRKKKKGGQPALPASHLRSFSCAAPSCACHSPDLPVVTRYSDQHDIRPNDPSRAAAASQRQPLVKVNRSLRPDPPPRTPTRPAPCSVARGRHACRRPCPEQRQAKERKGKGASCREAFVEPVALFLLERATGRARGARTKRDRARSHPRRARRQFRPRLGASPHVPARRNAGMQPVRPRAQGRGVRAAMGRP